MLKELIITVSTAFIWANAEIGPKSPLITESMSSVPSISGFYESLVDC